MIQGKFKSPGFPTMTLMTQEYAFAILERQPGYICGDRWISNRYFVKTRPLD